MVFLRILFALCFAFYLLQADDLTEFEKEFASMELKTNDPLSAYNKTMTQFNKNFYLYIARPVLQGYNFIIPQALRKSMSNFLSNLAAPLHFTGNLLQFKFKEANTELKRFAINTVYGFFGFIDAASITHIPKYPADLGTVLAHWGVGSGFHVVLPILGPSNLRDALSLPVNWYLTPISYLKSLTLSFGTGAYAVGNELSLHLDTIDDIYKNTPNLYLFLRDGYELKRKQLSQ